MKHEYHIYGYYFGKWERLHTEITKEEANKRLKEYRENEPQYKFKIVRGGGVK